jgi:hypothetical protein
VGEHAGVTPSGGGLLGTVVVRAWLEPGNTVEDVRARVLVVRSTDSEFREVGVAAGLDAVLALVSQGLHSVGEDASG